jgi:hypothetical protein
MRAGAFVAFVLCLWAGTLSAAETCEVAWKLPRGRKLTYEAQISRGLAGPDAMSIGVKLTVRLRAVRDGVALVDAVPDMGTATASGRGGAPGAAAGHGMWGILRAPGDLTICEIEAEGGDVGSMLAAVPTGNLTVGQAYEPAAALAPTMPDEAPVKSVVVLTGIGAAEGDRVAEFRFDLEGEMKMPGPPDMPPMTSKSTTSATAAFNLEMGCVQSVVAQTTIALGSFGKAELSQTVHLVSVDEMNAEELAEAERVLAVRQAVASACELAGAGKADEALAALEPAMDSELGSEHAPLIAAQILAGAERWQEAVVPLEKELAACPDSTTALLLAGRVYMRLGQNEKARAAEDRYRELARGRGK